jgi:broad specificity phosphatase PhoE
VDIHEAWQQMPYPDDDTMKKTILSLRQEQPSRVFSSPLKRARLTAEHVFAETPLFGEIIIEPLLSEIDFGKWEGLTWAEILNQFPDEANDWLENWQKSSPPAGETLAQVALRLKNFMIKWSPTHRDLLVCHGGIIKVFLALESCSFDSHKTQINHHSIYHVDLDKLDLSRSLF